MKLNFYLILPHAKKMLKMLWDFYIINLQLGPGSLVAWFKKGYTRSIIEERVRKALGI